LLLCRNFGTLYRDKVEGLNTAVLRKISIRHYLLISFSAAAFALVGEAICSLCKSGSLRSGEGTTTNALIIAPSRTPTRRPAR
jgi:hypothetical protein